MIHSGYVLYEKTLFKRPTEKREEYNLNNSPIFRVKCQSRLLK